MPKRFAAALLWFSASWVGYEIAWSLTGLPRLWGPLIAFAVAGLVAVDPFGMFWPRGDGAAVSSSGRSLVETPTVSR